MAEHIIGSPVPRMRQDLEITPISHQGQPMVLFSDALGLSQESFVVSPLILLIASLFDGSRPVKEIQQELTKQKIALSETEVQKVVDELKQHGLLETSETLDHRQKLYEKFKQSNLRQFFPKTRGLPENPLDLGRLFNRFFKDPKGPGEPFSGSPSLEPAIGLVCPHIDFFRGGPVYAWSYGELAKRKVPDVIVAVGVSHFTPRSPWVMTEKNYETPFGPMEVEKSLYAEIRKVLWYDPAEEEIVHAKEHSLEFQALWLKHRWLKDTPKWVPVLCSNFDTFCNGGAPSKIPTIEEAIRSIGKILENRARNGQRIMILAGIDLAHVGERFGDELQITDELKTKIETLDRESMQDAMRLEADKFFLSGVGEGSWRKICGLSALYTSLRWIRALSGGKVQGKLLSYDQAADPNGGIVSFASAVFDGEHGVKEKLP